MKGMIIWIFVKNILKLRRSFIKYGWCFHIFLSYIAISGLLVIVLSFSVFLLIKIKLNSLTLGFGCDSKSLISNSSNFAWANAVSTYLL